MFKSLQFLVFICLIAFSNITNAQITPDGILFQAVARDINGNAASGRNIYAKVTILKGTATGTVAYAESFKVVSSDDGIFTIIIGKGNRTSGATGLASIAWNEAFYFVNIKIAIEPSLPSPGWNVDNEYIDMGTSQLWSVPYALFATKSTVADSAMSISTIVPGSKGGTGINNDGKTITLAQNLNFKGVGDITITTTGASNISFPLTGLLANTQYVTDRIAADTISLSNRIDAIGVSAGNTSALKLNISDTASMLDPYLRKLDTASLSKRIDIKLDSAQIPGIIAPYLVTISGVKYTDTASMLSAYYNKTALDARLNLKVNLADTAAMLLPYAIRSNTEASINAEAATARAAELTLTNNVAANTASITANTSAIVAEATTARAAELILTNNVAANTASITANTNAIIAEATTARAAELVLTNNVAANTASITTNTNAIIAEATTARAAELILTNNVAANTASITANSASILTNTNNIASNTASITANTNAIIAEATTARAAELTLTNNVAANTASITVNTTNILTNTNNIASNTASITANTNAIIAEATTARAAELVLTNNVASNTASITANTTNIASNTASITANTTNIASNTASITANTNAIIAEATTARAAELLLTNNIAANTASITALDTRVTSNTNNIATNATDIASNTAAILSEATTARAAELTLTNNVAANTVSITANTANIASNTASITANTNAIIAEAATARAAELLLTNNIAANTASITANAANIETKAPLASPALTGTPTAPTATTGDNSTQLATTAFVAASITNSTTPDATASTKGKLKLANDLGGTADAPTVEKVGGSTAANINAATTLANAATASNTANVIVKRDANGNFTAGTITADLLGTATNVTGVVLGANGGTGINNAGKTITLGGDINTGASLTTTGTTVSNASNITLKTTGTTDLILPTTGTLSTLSGNEPLTNKTINGLTPTSLATGFSIAGGTSTKTLTVNNNATLSGTNTGDQTISLTGDVTGSGTGTFSTTLSNSGVTAGTYGSATSVPAITVDAKGRVTNVSNTTISGVSPVGSAMASGKIIVGDANNVASIVDMSGDVTINNNGATLIGVDKVTTDKILNSNITYAKIQNVTTNKILGRVSVGSGIVEEVATTGTGDVVRSISPTFTGAPQVPTPLVTSNDNTVANTQFVTRAIGNISASSVTGILPGSNGGTGIDNTGKTITLGGNLTTSGANNLTFTTTGATNVTIPTSGTLATTAQLDAIAGGSFSGGQITGVVAPANGGTGIANSNTITLGGNLLTGAAFTTTGTTGSNASAITFKTTAASTLTLPTTGILATLDGTETLTNKTISTATNTISGLTNANLSGTAGITDANLATISTTGKILNTATTATFSNTANSIVSRDASGNFSAGTITASLSGNASSASKLVTARTIYGNSFDGSGNLGQVISSTYGGTGNQYTKFTGATTSEKTYTLPDANTTILTTDALVTPAQGGTGVATAAANTIFAGPVSGINAAPSFRALTGADLPAGSGLYIANSTTQQASSNFNISGAGVIAGNLTAGSIIKKDGTAAQFLKADGSVDSRSFATITGAEALTNKSVNGVTPTAVTTGFTIAGGTTNNKTLTVAADANVAGTNTGDISLATGENYLSLSNQVLTANAVNLSGSNATGILAAARFPALTGDVTNTAGAVATTISANAVTSTKIAENAVTSTKIADNAISSAKIATSAVTLDKIASISVQKLLGNKSATAAGAPGEIAIGTGLALDASTGILSASGSGGTVTGTGTAGQMPYWSTTSGLGSTPNFIWDNTNKNIKIGENVNMVGVDNDLPSGVSTPIIGIVGKVNDLTEQTMLSMKRPLYYGNSVPGFVDFVMKGGSNSTKFDIRMNNFTNPTTLVNVMTILTPGGYVGINNSAPTEKLDVTGNIRFSGALKPNNLSGTAGQFLTSQGAGTPTWTTFNGVTSLGTISGTGNANGATITSGVLNLTPATETLGGVLTTGAQNIGGNKRFFGLLTMNENIQLNFSGSPAAGVIFTGDGDIVDKNDGYGTMRFTNGIRINDGNGSAGTTTNITLAGNGNITSTGTVESVGFKLTGGAPAAGKVLVSDANGVGSWSSSSPASLSGGVAGAVVYQSGSGTTSFTTAGTTGQILTSSGTTAPVWTSVLSVAQGGTGTSTQNFVDLNTNQTIGGLKTFSKDLLVNGLKIGRGTGQSEENTAFGSSALGSGTGYRNTAVGYTALSNYAGASFDNNTGIGYAAARALTTGQQNTALGAESLTTLTTAGYNTALGAQTLMSSNGANNTAVGYAAGAIIGAGTNNTFVGANSNANLATRTNATAVGYGAIVTADNTIQLGNTSVTTISTTGTFSTSGSINASGAITTPVYASTPVALTAGATITWTPLSGLNASVTLNANSTLAFGATPPAGSSGTLIVTQPATGGPYNLTLPTVAGKTNKVLGSSSGILLSTTAGAKDIVSFFYDGNDFYWNVGMGYGMAQNVSANTVSGGVAGAILYQTAANTTGFSAAGTTGQYLRSNGTTAPTWSTISNASASTSGFLTSTDWAIFNSKQNSITNPVTGTGTISALPYWSSTSALSSDYTSASTYTNGLFWDNTNGRLGINTKYPTSAFQVGDAGSSENTKYTTALNFDYDLSQNSSLSVKTRNEKFEIRTVSSSGVWNGLHFSYNPSSSTIGSRIDFMSFDPGSQVVTFNKLRLAGNGAGAGKFLVSDASGNAAWTSGSFVDLSTAQNIGGTKTFTATGNGAIVNNNLSVNAAGLSGQGIIFSDDGDIVDLNDGAATFRFSGGVKVNNGNKTLGTSNVITLSNNGNITATGSITATGNLVAGAITYPNVAGTNGYVLTTNGTNTATWAAPSGAVSGGITNAIPKYTSATALGASSITDDGTTISFSNKTVAGGSAAVNSASIAAGTTAYTLQQSDNGKVINCANTGALTITIPTGLTAGFNCMIVQMAAGTVTISAGASTTIYNRSNYSKTGGQYAIATIVSPSANVFITGGDMQ